MTTRQNETDFLPARRKAYRGDRPVRFARSTKSPRRFVTQSHALSAPIASPRALLIAAAIAIALYLIGVRLSD